MASSSSHHPHNQRRAGRNSFSQSTGQDWGSTEDNFGRVTAPMSLQPTVRVTNQFGNQRQDPIQARLDALDNKMTLMDNKMNLLLDSFRTLQHEFQRFNNRAPQPATFAAQASGRAPRMINTIVRDFLESQVKGFYKLSYRALTNFGTGKKAVPKLLFSLVFETSNVADAPADLSFLDERYERFLSKNPDLANYDRQTFDDTVVSVVSTKMWNDGRRYKTPTQSATPDIENSPSLLPCKRSASAVATNPANDSRKRTPLSLVNMNSPASGLMENRQDTGNLEHWQDSQPTQWSQPSQRSEQGRKEASTTFSLCKLQGSSLSSV
ncbi:hypothetical protein DFS34DRAFT_380284 [Phlyctochytrium arcticum]|nr:hypothetical protein DFS34DRAFT_500090 [Phlyctochytrium arcticum]KAI9090007.1 hypothetical protein DFS34DRAFT_380284 [Phlyctochytrium arcticum]